MEKELLIKALRICANQTCCDNCPRYDIDHTQDAQRCCIQLINDAADALEAAEQRIEELERKDDADYQASVLMQEYFERYEPTYNSEDGSM